MSARWLLVSWFTIAACTSSKKRAFQRLSDELDPLLIAMRPQAAVAMQIQEAHDLLSKFRHDFLAEADNVAAELCQRNHMTFEHLAELQHNLVHNADDALRKLRRVQFDDPYVNPYADHRRPSPDTEPLSLTAAYLLDQEPLHCVSDPMSRSGVSACDAVEDCASFELEIWSEMVREVDRLRELAADVDVTIVRLAP